MSPQHISALVPLIALLVCGPLLVHYRLRRRFKEARTTTWKVAIEHNVVEILIFAMFMALAAPNWGSLLLSKLP